MEESILLVVTSIVSAVVGAVLGSRATERANQKAESRQWWLHRDTTLSAVYLECLNNAAMVHAEAICVDGVWLPLNRIIADASHPYLFSLPNEVRAALSSASAAVNRYNTLAEHSNNPGLKPISNETVQAHADVAGNALKYVGDLMQRYMDDELETRFRDKQ